MYFPALPFNASCKPNFSLTSRPFSSGKPKNASVKSPASLTIAKRLSKAR